MIVEHPASLKVNVGETATFAVVASGNPILNYQWQFNGLEIAGATQPVLTIPDVQESHAGLYCVRVTNWFGTVLSSNAVLTVNHPPVADASALQLLYISCNGTNAAAVLDGSRSTDSDGDPLEYAWFHQLSGTLLSTQELAGVILPSGGNAIALVVNDGLASDTNIITVEVITPAEAVERLMVAVRARVERSMPLIATLRAALASIDRSNPVAAINQLKAFCNLVHPQAHRLIQH